jgi:hypothetical protein
MDTEAVLRDGKTAVNMALEKRKHESRSREREYSECGRASTFRKYPI